MTYRHTLRDSLDILLPHLSPELVAPGVKPGIRELAHKLPPIHRAIFECRLGPNASQVDLLQCIQVGHGEPSILAEWVATATPTRERPLHPAWACVREFCTRWADSSSPLHAGVRETWLEFDIVSPIPPVPPPSFFFGLRPEITTSEAYAVIEESLELLLGESKMTPLRRNLVHCLEVSREVALVNQIGTMLSRPTDALRLCIQGVAPDQVIPYLLKIGWPGPVKEMERLMAGLFRSVDHIAMVDIDIGPIVHPKVGLEVRFERQPADEPRWAAFLADLVEEVNLCMPEKQKALLAWPGIVKPPTSSVPWPAQLIIESLSEPSDRFSLFTRRLSHFKIVYQPQQSLEAKAYLLFEHTWLQP